MTGDEIRAFVLQHVEKFSHHDAAVLAADHAPDAAVGGTLAVGNEIAMVHLTPARRDSRSVRAVVHPPQSPSRGPRSPG